MGRRAQFPGLAMLVTAALAACAAAGRSNVGGSGGYDGTSSGEGGTGDGRTGVFDPSNPDASPDAPSTTCAPDPANVEIAGNGCDDDGDGTTDVIETCDQGLDVAANAASFAHALGLCKQASPSSWGLVSAKYVNGFTRNTPPAEGQHGILPAFGFNIAPREGTSLAVLSTGWAREYDSETSSDAPFNDQPPNAIQTSLLAGVEVATHGEPPPGWPKEAQGCPQLSTDTFDMAGIELAIKVPQNATALGFDFDFYSGEWPQWVCSRFNDGFVAMLDSKANKSGDWENISFDAKGNPVSVNFAFFDRCTANVKMACKESAPVTSVCAGGTFELAGTGFAIADDYCGYGTTSSGGGATGWLASEAPVVPGETIRLRLLIWDTGDYKFDSSVVLDHIHWVATSAPAKPQTERAPPIVH